MVQIVTGLGYSSMRLTPTFLIRDEYPGFQQMNICVTSKLDSCLRRNDGKQGT